MAHWPEALARDEPSLANASGQCFSVSLIMAGHQPELFHPGVWIKNFAINGLARKHGLTPINLIVDNDTAKTISLQMPAPASDENPLPHVQTVPFDEWAGDVPYEERTVRNEELFAGFPQRVDALLGNWNYTPMLGEFWAEVKQQAQRTPLLGERFAAARRTFERRWGCHNLELPVSILCQTEPFAMFACHLLADLPRFHAIYNDCVRDYRRRHGIHSRNHPVPDLAAEGNWLEAPFWAWRGPDAPQPPLRSPASRWPDLTRRGRNLASITTHHSPLTTHHSPLTTHHSPLTTHHSPLHRRMAGHATAWLQNSQPSVDEHVVRSCVPGGPVHSRHRRRQVR